MLITVDAGNTETVFGVWHDSQCRETFRVATSRSSTADDWQNQIVPRLGAGSLVPGKFDVALVSVVPAVEEPLELSFQALGARKVQIFTREMKYNFQFNPRNFPTVGLDRLVNVAAGARFFGENLIIVDFGTAITFCLLLEGEYRGGVIAPGIHVSMESLTSRTASLPEISFRRKESALAQKTSEQLESGFYFGWKGMVREILSELRAEAFRLTEKEVPLKVIATGGISSSLGFSHDFFNVVDPFLTLRGIHEIFYLNQ